MPAMLVPGVDFGRPRFVLLALALLVLALAAAARVAPAGASSDPHPATSDGAMVLAGTAWVGERPAPAGTLLLARVGDAVCGVALATEPTPGLNYRLTVLSAAERPGCGTAGAPVTVQVGSAVAAVRGGSPPTYRPGLTVLDLAVP